MVRAVHTTGRNGRVSTSEHNHLRVESDNISCYSLGLTQRRNQSFVLGLAWQNRRTQPKAWTVFGKCDWGEGTGRYRTKQDLQLSWVLSKRQG